MTDGDLREGTTAATSPIRASLGALEELVRVVSRDHAGEIAELARAVEGVVRSGGTLFFAGNGGSAADAQHLAAEYVVRFSGDRRALPALALTTDTSILTAAGNDLGFDQVFARQVRALARPGDLLILHSTSGESENLVQAARAAREAGVATAALLARGGGRLAGLVDRALVLPTESTARAQELHLTIGHLVCEHVERVLGSTGGGS